MNAEEIRKTPLNVYDPGIEPGTVAQADCAVFLREIAAQLAEIKELLKARDPEAHLPEECRKHECSYYRHYLIHGAPDLTHEGFHNAEQAAEAHMKACSRSNSAKECASCFNWERVIRA